MFHKSSSPAPALTLNGVTTHPPPLNPTPTHTQPSSSTLPPTSLTPAQHKFCLSTLRNLKKSKDVQPFLPPVDIMAMNIPDYPKLITQPMDFKTIEEKLANSIPRKDVPKPDEPRYLSVDQFITDVRLVFSNCVKFNGSDHMISMMGMRSEELFNKSIKNLLPPEEPKPIPVKKAPPPPPPPAPTTVTRNRAPCRPSMATPVISTYADDSKKSRKPRAAKNIAEKARQQPTPAASSSNKPTEAPTTNVSATVLGDDGVLTFEQKDLFTKGVQNLNGQKLERVIQIIHNTILKVWSPSRVVLVASY